MGTTPHFTRGKSGKLRPEGMNQIAESSDLQPEQGAAYTPPGTSQPNRPLLFPILVILKSFDKPPEEPGAIYYPQVEDDDENDDGDKDEEEKPLYYGFSWSEIIFDKELNTWSEAGRTGAVIKGNLAYPIGVPTQIPEALPFMNYVLNTPVMLHPYNDRKGKPYLGFEMAKKPNQGDIPLPAFVGEITSAGNQCNISPGNHTYTVQPLRVTGMNSITDVIEYEVDPNRTAVTATNTLEYNGGHIGGQIGSSPSEDCTIAYTYTPIIVGQRVVVHTSSYEVFGTSLTIVPVYYFCVPPDICIDCCVEDGGFQSITPAADIPFTAGKYKQNKADIITEMLR